MPRDRQPVGACSRCQGPVTCSYNVFQDGEERIDSWEHRCRDCSDRSTQAFRTGGDNPEPDADPRCCPFCGRRAPEL
jgi:hypothetical protein